MTSCTYLASTVATLKSPRCTSPDGRQKAPTSQEGGFIVLNPHDGNCCVLRLDGQAATALYHLLGEWLVYEPVDD